MTRRRTTCTTLALWWFVGMPALPAWSEVPTASAKDRNERSSPGAFGNVRLRIGGRAQLDSMIAESATDGTRKDSGVRRANLALRARWGHDLSIGAAASINGSGIELRTVTATWTGIEDTWLRIGLLPGLAGMEQRTSSSSTLLMERATVAALASSIMWGAVIGYAQNNSSVEVALTAPSGSRDAGSRDSNGAGAALRLGWHTAVRSGGMLHVGVTAERREHGGESRLRVRARPESALFDDAFLDTRWMRGIRHRTTYGVEVAFLDGPLTVQAEYLRADVARTSRDVTLHGGYVQAGWFATGEARPFRLRTATVGSIRPRTERGAIELVARYSYLDLASADVAGGVGTAWNAGVNWFATPDLQLSVNASRAFGWPDRRGRDDTVDVLQARLQVSF